jgi:antitoxin ParD1/3/4
MRKFVKNDQKREADEPLEKLLLEGVDSGEPLPLTKEDWQEIRREVRRHAAIAKANERRPSSAPDPVEN